MTDEIKNLCLQPLTNEKRRAFQQWLYSMVEKRISYDVYKDESKFCAYKNLVRDAYVYSTIRAKETENIPIECDFVQCFMDMEHDIPNHYAAWFARYCGSQFTEVVHYEKIHEETSNEIESELIRIAEEKQRKEEYHRRTIEKARKSGLYSIVFKAIENPEVGGSGGNILTITELLKERFPHDTYINVFSALCFQLGVAQGIHNERNRRKNKKCKLY